MPSRSPLTSFALAALAMSVAASTIGPAAAQLVPMPWQVVQERFGALHPAAQGHYLRSRTVRVDVDLLRALVPGDRIDLDLMPGVRVQGELERVSDDPFNGYVLRGRVVGEPNSMITLVLEDDGLAGTISLSAGDFQLRYVGEGLSAVLESDPARRREDDVRIAPPVARRPSQAASQRSATTYLDILGVYTPVPMNQLGGKKAIIADFKTAIANMQTAFDNSGLGVQVRLIKTAKLPYGKRGADPGFFQTGLQDLTAQGDGQLEKVHQLRNRFGADIVVLAAEINETLCGLGWLPGDGSGVGPEHEFLAFNIDSVDCLAGFGGLTVAHESGHNMGLNHDEANARLSQLSGAYSYSYGHRVPGQFRTLMSYPCENQGLLSCPEIPVYSSPLITYDGTPVGVANVADNRRSLNNDLGVVTEWRACKKKCN